MHWIYFLKFEENIYLIRPYLLDIINESVSKEGDSKPAVDLKAGISKDNSFLSRMGIKKDKINLKYLEMVLPMEFVIKQINVNFLSPYQSASITEFWKRWHISLSSWLKDYLYIRWLGGNRKGKIRTKINLIITMLLGGFWHGASWNFIFWGALHGTALVVDKIWNNITGKFIPKNWIVRIVGVLITFHFVCFCWIFFKFTTPYSRIGIEFLSLYNLIFFKVFQLAGGKLGYIFNNLYSRKL